MYLTQESTKNPKTKRDLEDRITYILSEWLNDAAPLGQKVYAEPAKAVVKEVLAWKSQEDTQE